MILDGFHRLRGAGVLGMNSRNAEYIMAQNARSAYPVVDDKVLTKRLAEKFGIPIPELYAVVENHGSIASLPRVLDGLREFVVKPARGSGGSGIILIKGKTAEGPVFADVTSQEGVPDERIIVYRGVPVMAMVRLPTEASDGKANLHRGAIGAGIDIGSGVTLSAVHRSRIVDKHPDTDNPVSGIRLPHWDGILLMAAKATEMTGLGYLGADFVLDRERGPVLLELNARPGLAIQIANRTGLRERLDRTDGAPPAVFASAESRVAWARRQFRQDADRSSTS